MSVLRYPGGKSRAIKTLEGYIPEDAKVIISPFTGGGSFEIHLRNKGKVVLCNDKFEPLWNFWFCLLNDKIELVRQVNLLTPCTKEMWSEMRRNIMLPTIPCYQRAAYYFVINRCSFSGSTLSGGFSAESAEKRFTRSSIDRLLAFNAADIDIQNMDCIDFIELNEEYDYMYLDPPYYLPTGNKLYGRDGDMHENFDHDALYTQLTTRENWVMSYNDCEWVREKYKDYTIVPAAWSYGMNKTKKSSEVIITSIR